MRAAPALLVLAACNSTFELRDTRRFDAREPPSCPASGPPPLSDQIHQAVFQDCLMFNASAVTDTAMAMCLSSNGYTNSYGHIDGPLAPVDLPGTPLYPALSAEGDAAIGLVGSVSHEWTLQGDAWADAGALPLPRGYYSATSARPNRHILGQENDQMIHEFAEDAPGVWHEVMPPYVFASVAGIDAPPYFSPDGLRLIIEGEMISTTAKNGYVNAVMYADRASIDARFGDTVAIAAAPVTMERPYLTVDCARLYFHGVSEVLYLAQP
jgi:hypothetical protein